MKKYFPWLPGLLEYETIAYRKPVKGDYFIKQNQVFLAALDQNKVRQIVRPKG